MGVIVAPALLAVAPPLLARVDGPAPAVAGAVPGAAVSTYALPIGICAAAFAVLVILWWKDVIRPGSLARHAKRDLGGIPAAIWFAAALAMFAAPILAGGYAAQLPAAVIGGPGSLRQTGTVALAAYAVAMACGGLLLYLLSPRASSATGLTFRGKDLLIGGGIFALCLPVVLAAGIVAAAVYTLIMHHEPEQVAHATLRLILDDRSNPWVWTVILAAVVGAPVVEELTYRVFLQSALRRVLVSPLAAVIVASGLFALVHRLGDKPVPWHAIPTLFVLALVCGVSYERTRRIGVPIMIHACFNAYNVLVALFALPDH